MKFFEKFDFFSLSKLCQKSSFLNESHRNKHLGAKRSPDSCFSPNFYYRDLFLAEKNWFFEKRTLFIVIPQDKRPYLKSRFFDRKKIFWNGFLLLYHFLGRIKRFWARFRAVSSPKIWVWKTRDGPYIKDLNFESFWG